MKAVRNLLLLSPVAWLVGGASAQPACEATRTTTVTVYQTIYSVQNSSTTWSSPASSSTVDSLSASVGTTTTATADTNGPSASAAPTPVPDQPQSGGPAGSRNAVYFASWGIYGSDTRRLPQELPVSAVSHVLYAFANIMADGTVVGSDAEADTVKDLVTGAHPDGKSTAYGCVRQLFLLKQQNRHLRTLLSIGGWTYSAQFAVPASTAAGRQTFASSAVKLMADWGFDGLDIDWEYPADASQAENMVLLLQACRQALDEYSAQHAEGYHFELTVASSANVDTLKLMRLAEMDAYLDAWNVMAYDYAGSWDATTGHQANLFSTSTAATKFSTDAAIEYYLSQGISPAKLSLGVPLYGRVFANTDPEPGSTFSGLGSGGDLDRGMWRASALPRPGAVTHYDAAAAASYSYDPARRELVSYDDARALDAKLDYVAAHALAGLFFWEARGDAVGPDSLVQRAGRALAAAASTANNLRYPTSPYDNIRNGGGDAA